MDNAGRKVALNTVILTGTELVAKIMALALVMAVARRLGPELMGIYGFGTVFIGFFEIVVNFGLEPYIQREIGRDPDKAGVLLARVFTLKTIVYLVCLVLILISALYVADTGLKRQVIWIMTAAMFFNSQMMAVNSFFRGVQKATLEAAVRMLFRLIYTIVGLVAILGGAGLLSLCFIQLVSQVIGFGAAWWLFLTRVQRPVWDFNAGILGELVRATKDFLFIRVVNTIFNTADVLMISFIAGDYFTGLYLTAGRLPAAFDFVPAAFSGAFLPALSRASEDRAEFIRMFRPHFKYMLILGLGALVAMAGWAEGIMSLLFGDKFDDGAQTMAILSLTLVLTFVSWSLSNALFALNLERSQLKIFSVAATANILLNLALIPLLDHNGAAWATVLCRGGLIVAQVRSLDPELLAGLGLPKLSLMPIIAALIGLVGARAMVFSELNIFLGLVLTGLLFAFALLGTRAVTLEEVKEVKEIVKAGRKAK